MGGGGGAQMNVHVNVRFIQSGEIYSNSAFIQFPILSQHTYTITHTRAHTHARTHTRAHIHTHTHTILT